VITEWCLSLPRKIDFLVYTTGAGGEFFNSLIVLACPKTKSLIQSGPGFILNNSQSRKNKVPTYDKPKLLTQPLGQWLRFMFYSGSLMTSHELIVTCKSTIYAAMVHHASSKHLDSPIGLKDQSLPEVLKGKLDLLFKDTLLILARHDDGFADMNELSKFNLCDYWDVVDINPITKEGRACVSRAVGHIFNDEPLKYHRQSKELLFYSSNPDIEKFPFFDYLIYEDYAEIQYFLENRYGSNLDFDFIDKSLKTYRTTRVVPFLPTTY